jgi:exosortase A-associated hydrolase 1
MSQSGESGLVFECEGDSLVGVLHAPPGGARRPGVLVIVGGPQYRVGSHRQFTLMARDLAAAGFPVLRFDYRGMGDSDGAPRSFEAAGADITAAIAAFSAAAGGSLDGVVLFGLCDAASAALMYGAREPSVKGMVLANPWVRSEAGEAKSYVRHYYGRRLLQGSFWRKLLAGETRILASIRDFMRKLAASRAGSAGGGGFVAAMHAGLLAFRGPVLLFQSGRDLTAGEFDDLCADDADWRSALQAPGIELVRLADADHTFSRRDHLDEVARRMVAWMRELRPAQDAEPCR